VIVGESQTLYAMAFDNDLIKDDHASVEQVKNQFVNEILNKSHVQTFADALAGTQQFLRVTWQQVSVGQMLCCPPWVIVEEMMWLIHYCWKTPSLHGYMVLITVWLQGGNGG